MAEAIRLAAEPNSQPSPDLIDAPAPEEGVKNKRALPPAPKLIGKG